MFERAQSFLRRHPSVRDALLWVIPALLFGAFIRGCLLYYSPLAYWGSDSRSYYDFIHKLLAEHYLSLIEKRRVLYPLFCGLVTALPGTPLRWLAWIQHGMGLLTLVPIAYVVRKNFVAWRWWIMPITLLYASHPVIVWYEHELLGETLFFDFIVWAFAGWCAWVPVTAVERSRQLWWWFFVPFAGFILTRPAGRFFWPGLLVGLVLVSTWRRLGRVQIGSIFALMVATLLIGERSQAAWLFYTATFPLTQLETPLHHEYKAQIRDMVEQARQDLAIYHSNDGDVFNFLEVPKRGGPERTLWVALPEKSPIRTKLYMDLAIEGICAEPLTFLRLGLQRLAVSSNLPHFKLTRFSATNYPQRFADDYENAVKRLHDGTRTPVPLALGYPIHGPLPPYDELRQRLSPHPDSWPAQFVPGLMVAYASVFSFIYIPMNDRIDQGHLTFLGFWMLAAIALTWLVPRYRPTLGVWSLAAFTYAYGVFLVTQQNPRYFGGSWPILIPLLAVPLDALVVAVSHLRRRRLVK